MSVMRRLLPQSMAGLIAVGFVVAAAPLLVSVVLAELALHRVADHGELLVHESVALARLSAQVRDEIVDLERGARQYAVIRNEELLKVFRDRLERVASSIDTLKRHGLTDSFRRQLGGIEAGLDRVRQDRELITGDGTASQSLIDDIHALAPRARELISLSNQAVEQESGKLQAAAGQARAVVTLSLMALVPLTALLAFGVTLIINQPLRRAQAGIDALGRGRHDLPVKITYPREMMELGRNLDWLRRRLGELEEDKDRFIRNVSHELKTPLASLKEGIDLLAEGKVGAVSPAQSEVLQILGDSAGELEQLIGNLLAYARWQSERGKAEMTWFELYPLVEDVLRARRLSIVNRNLDVRLDLTIERIHADPVTLREALDNLISNAIKHTRDGTRIEISARATDEGFTLAVRDFGRGVPLQDQLRIFDPFERGSEQEEAGIRGTGIGLAIVRETAQAHGGKVEVINANPGAQFVLQWPLAAASR